MPVAHQPRTGLALGHVACRERNVAHVARTNPAHRHSHPQVVACGARRDAFANRLEKHLGAPRFAGERDYTLLERMWARPTLDVNGLLSGWTGEGSKTVIPAVSMAKVSMRLVPNQTPEKIAQLFEAYIRKITPKTVDVRVTNLHGGMPWMTEFDNPYVQAAGRAIEKGFGKRPVFTREGGSIPIVNDFKRILGADTLLLGLALTDDNAHSPNEKFDLDCFSGGMRMAAQLWQELAAA